MANEFELTLSGNLTNAENGDRMDVFVDAINITDSQNTVTLELYVDGTNVYTRDDLEFDAGERRHINLVWNVSGISGTERKTVEVRTAATNDVSDQKPVLARAYDDQIRARYDDGVTESYVKDASEVGPDT
jgi:hypothetical protein